MLVKESISFQKTRDPKSALDVSERNNLYQNVLENLIEEIRKEFPDYVGGILHPTVPENNFVIGFKNKDKKSYFAIHYTLLEKEKDESFFLTYNSAYNQSVTENFKIKGKPFEALKDLKNAILFLIEKDILAKKQHDDLQKETDLSGLRSALAKNRKKYIKETLMENDMEKQQLSEEEICKMVDEYVADIEDHLVYYLELSGYEFVEKFNEYVRNIFPELKDDPRNFYEIYDKCRS